MKIVIIQASARSDGHTYQIIQSFQKYHPSTVIDLKQYQIAPYSYQHEYTDDDFLPIMRKVVNYDTIIFATPVYWYSMSGLLKNFFDRMTDCLKVEKELGRQLRGKAMAAIACGSEPTPTEGFFIPFELTAGYLGMRYLGSLHTYIDENGLTQDVVADINQFIINHVR